MKCRREIFTSLLELDLRLLQTEWFNGNQIPCARWCGAERQSPRAPESGSGLGAAVLGRSSHAPALHFEQLLRFHPGFSTSCLFASEGGCQMSLNTFVFCFPGRLIAGPWGLSAQSQMRVCCPYWGGTSRARRSSPCLSKQGNPALVCCCTRVCSVNFLFGIFTSLSG